jgi:hypothetical protein
MYTVAAQDKSQGNKGKLCRLGEPLRDWNPGILAPCSELEGHKAAFLWPSSPGRGESEGPWSHRQSIDREGVLCGCRDPSDNPRRERSSLQGPNHLEMTAQQMGQPGIVGLCPE